MKFDRPLQKWRFLGREKRFFIYGTEDGQIAHCPNTGSMKNLLDATHVWVSDHGPDCARKLRYTAEILELADGTLVGINTMRTNALAVEALQAGLVDCVGIPARIHTEAKWTEGTRFDLKLLDKTGAVWWGEVKNVTLAESGTALFPDAKTTRGAKHLHELEQVVLKGEKALQLYVIQRGDCGRFTCASGIDSEYSSALAHAAQAGVHVAVVSCVVRPDGIIVDKYLPFVV